MNSAKITPCLWLETREAQAVIDYYLSIFKDSRLVEHHKFQNPLERGGESFETARIVINGLELEILAAGPYFKFNEAISLVIHSKDQAEVDYYSDALTANGGQEVFVAGVRINMAYRGK